MKLGKRVYGKAGNDEILEYTVSNTNGITIRLLSYGATLSSVLLPDRNGKVSEVTLGLDSLEGYLGDHPYLGTTLGRVANRIARGRFVLDGHTYALAQNDGENHLHGGIRGFNRAVWGSSSFEHPTSAGVMFHYVSRNGEEGYPGNLDVKVGYTLTEDDTLSVKFEAETDRSTPVNLSNHAYWNLKGPGMGDIKDHLITIHAEAYLPVDANLIPTGERRTVAGTPYDFRVEKRLGQDLAAVKGYDVCYVIDGPAGQLREAARVFESSTGRGFVLSTTQPGMQFYSGHMLPGIQGRGGARYLPYGAFAMETEGFPDAVNQPLFPSVILRPGGRYAEETQLRFFYNQGGD